MTQQSTTPESAGPARPSKYYGQLGELTLVQPLKPGGAEKVRELMSSSADRARSGLSGIGTVHNARVAFLNNDTWMLFATTYDGDWDQYIDDFASKGKGFLDELWQNCEGYPGIESPEVKDYIHKHQIDVEFWWVAYPEATAKQINKGQRVLTAWEQMLDTAAE